MPQRDPLSPRQKRSRGQGQTVVIDGRRRPVRRREHIRGRCYFLLEQLGPPPRERWLAYDAAARASRVLLILPRDSSTSQHLRVLRDIECNALPRILDIGFDDRSARVVMPWVKGVDVQEYLKRIDASKVQPPEPFQVLRLMLELARGLRALHCHANVIHGDIKPANLILTRKSSHVRLIDFGSAWPSGMTGVRSIAEGTSAVYAAPELRNGHLLNERVDQFSASVVFYQLLTGSIPYDGLGGKAGWPEWHQAGMKAVPPSSMPLSARFVPRRVWREIDAVVLKGIQLDPGQRFPHSSAWVDAIEAVFLQLRRRTNPRLRYASAWDHVCQWIAERIGYREQERVRA